MSYDLDIEVSPRELESLPGAEAAVEITGTASRAIVALNGEESALYPFVVALLSWAHAQGVTVFDPQLGRALSTVAELDWLTPPQPAGKSQKTLLNRWTKAVLAPLGFRVEGSRLVVRTVDGMVQGFAFLPPKRGSLAVDVFWTLRPDGDASRVSSFTATRRLGTLREPPQHRFAAPTLEAGMHAAMRAAEQVGLPYLDRYAGIPRLLQGANTGELTASQAFGPDPGWQAFHHAECLAYVGDNAGAIASYQVVIDQHTGSYDWMIERRDTALKRIAALA